MATTQTRSRRKKAQTSGTLEVFFTSNALKGLVLFSLLSFNTLVLKNSFLLVMPEGRLSGNAQIDATLYGIAIAVLMVIILFHEQNWANTFCPGAITLYINLAILVFYLKWLEWLMGAWWSLWALSGLLIILPVMGLFVMVAMLKS